MPRLSKIGAAALAAFGWTTGAAAVTASYLVVAGGGSGGRENISSGTGGGGGAGGLLTGTTSLNPTLSYAVTVGAGGAVSGSSGTVGSNGSSSVFNTITSIGGGGGGGGASLPASGAAGGSGGGAAGTAGGTTFGTGIVGQGNNGGSGGGGGGGAAAGGGGGSGAVGGNATTTNGGAGGAGSANPITGSTTGELSGGIYYLAGGGGGSSATGGTAGAAGVGGGGTGAQYVTGGATSGTANLGGGGGGGSNNSQPAGAGGSGVVIISYVGAQQFGGGVVTSSGGNTIHTFTTSGTLSPLSSLTASYLLVAGGGGGGATFGGGYGGAGGGGAGGLLSGSGVTIDTNSTYLVTVGASGAGGASAGAVGTNGGNSAFSMVTTTAVGGGGGASFNNTPGNGGSGGGCGYQGSSITGGTGTVGQGNNGGNGSSGSGFNGSGGGGAFAAGTNANSGSTGVAGGSGLPSSISGSSVTYAGGGGSGGYAGGAGGTGGAGGGGDGGVGGFVGNSGENGKGGGGGGGGGANLGTHYNGGNGGSGVVIISYPGSTQQMAGGTVTVAGGNVIHTFTSSGYLTPIVNVNNSLRFRSSASAYLSRTFGSATSTTTGTFSFWMKRGRLSNNYQYLWSASNYDLAYFDSNDNLWIAYLSNLGYVNTNMVFRDPSAWYHVVIVFDTTNAIAANRLQVYVNGVAQTLNWGSTPQTQNATWQRWNVSGYTGNIGNLQFNNTNFFDGYFAEYYFIDGQALTPNSFGTSNGLGVWQPIRYGGSYGTNGFYLPFTGGSSYYGSFNGSSQYLQATLPATLTGAFTVESYFYRSGSGNNYIFTLGDCKTSTGVEYYLASSGTQNQVYSNDAVQISSTSNLPVVSAWNHLAFTRDSSNVTRLFVNGVQVGSTWTTSAAFSSTLRIGVEFYNSAVTGYANGGLSNFRVINGTALYTSNFAPPTSALTAVSGTAILTLQSSTIIDNSGNSLSITNNGTVVTSQAYPFTMLGNQSKDYSPQGNNWTNNNIGVLAGSTLDIMTDVPTLTSATTANYCVLNPLKSNSSTSTYQNGNLQVTFPNAGAGGIATGTMAVSSGKFYWEVTVGGTDGSTQPKLGIISPTVQTETSSSIDVGDLGYAYVRNGNKSILGTVTAYGSSFTTNDVIGFALDMDAGTLVCYKNNVSQGTLVSGLTGQFTAGLTAYNGYSETINFGQQPFTYTPPTGFVGLNTYNLPTPTIGATASTTANKYFDATLYTGNGTVLGSTQTITNAGSFQPDLVWLKSRSNAQQHNLYDVVRGISSGGSPTLFTDATTQETTYSGYGVSALNSNGFTVIGNGGLSNNNGFTYVGWQWKANGAGVTNTAGSINSSVSASTTSGFSIVTYTGNSTNGATVGHGLLVGGVATAPSMIIVKVRNATARWVVYQKDVTTANNQFLELDTTAGVDTSGTNFWTISSINDTTFGLGTNGDTNGSTLNFVAYCFAPVAGYSKFGTYTGNGVSDGTFVYLGFRPKFVLIKSTASGTNWVLHDSSREPFNEMGTNSIGYALNPENDVAESTNANLWAIDFTSNGFKNRSNSASVNSSGQTYIYMAFAENPFKYANAK